MVPPMLAIDPGTMLGVASPLAAASTTSQSSWAEPQADCVSCAVAVAVRVRPLRCDEICRHIACVPAPPPPLLILNNCNAPSRFTRRNPGSLRTLVFSLTPHMQLHHLSRGCHTETRRAGRGPETDLSSLR